ncbi:tryptophan-rich sensory protein [Aquimarina brevivitae]|uniref:TspO/MBR related protein n=1 Tax=Aquimarina brevivitae TaxID=323412 RepID=A0A4Q7PF32_9FLAO|nr:tryptophan-rich sensory protein [Aquimarina brevivitae]RZS99056.1 hypothetical protein EV197_0260 [Aquimarina brevivitae]
MKKRLAILNLLSVIYLIAINYIAEAVRFNDTNVAALSRKYDNLFTPSSYAFAIWLLIFTGLIAYSINQIRTAYNSPEKGDYIEKTSYWFVLANVFTGSWVVVFVYEYTAASVLVMLGILFCLLKIIINTNINHGASPKYLFTLKKWPISLYAGWISVASIANISVYLTKIEWKGFGLSEVSWTLIILAIAVVLNLFMILNRNMRVFGSVGVWALIAIYVRHQGDYNSIAYMALGGAILLAVTIIGQFLLKKSYHTTSKEQILS